MAASGAAAALTKGAAQLKELLAAGQASGVPLLVVWTRDGDYFSSSLRIALAGVPLQHRGSKGGRSSPGLLWRG